MSGAEAVNVTEFGLALKGFAELTDRQARLAKAELGLQVLGGVIQANPVDTGRMRAGWQITVGAPGTESPAPGAYGADAGAQAMAEGLSRASEAPLDAPLWVVNNVEYSGFVEAHHPTKAGFVAAVVENVAAQFDSAAGGDR